MRDSYTNPEDIRLVHTVEFKSTEVPVIAITDGEQGEKIIQVQTELSYTDDLRWPDTWMTRKAPRGNFLINVFEALDRPGEWHHNRQTNEVYYYPYSWQNMDQLDAWLPRTEFLMEVTGHGTNDKARNITFQGITFRYGTWLDPRDQYFGMSQAEFMPNYKETVPGQVILNHTEGITFHRNTFVHHASCGLQVREDSDTIRIEGNVFYDLTAAGITVGIGNGSIGDEEYDDDMLCHDIVVKNNVVRSTGADYIQATGINAVLVNGLTVSHNDVADISYAGIHQRGHIRHRQPFPGIPGLMITNNVVAQAMMMMRDGGMIYQYGPMLGTEISGNVVRNSVEEKKNTHGYYLDNNASGVLLDNNVALQMLSDPLRASNGKIGLHGPVIVRNFYTDKPISPKSIKGPILESVIDIKPGALPQEVQDIVANAGLQEPYQDLLRQRSTGLNIALGKPTTSSNTSLKSTQAAVDGQLGSGANIVNKRQRARSPDQPVYLQIDLQAPHVIRKVIVRNRQDVQIQASNDPTFSDIVFLGESHSQAFRYGGSSAGTIYTNHPKGFRYLRVLSIGTGAFGISELEVYGNVFAEHSSE